VSHWIVVPVILPAVVAALMILTMRLDTILKRVVSLATLGVLLGVALALFLATLDGSVESYDLGQWPAPFGIVLVLDRLSALMVLLTTVLAAAVLVYAIATNWDNRGRHFHPLFQFQLMGLFGAMLTGDIFNLFVFFEILLIASYGLMIHGGGTLRLRAGVQYVIFNLAGSTLFLFALGSLYALLGTLNMADMALRLEALPEGEAAMVRVTAALLLMVFALKGALLPLHFWLPNTYALAPAPVAALFAIMTKVGAYAILRVYTLAFHPELPALGEMVPKAILPGAMLTLLVGMVGVLAGGALARVAAFAAIGSMGTLFLALGLFTPETTTAALYYLIHSTLAGAALFLIVDQVQARRGTGALVALPPMIGSGMIAGFFFVTAIAMAGMPPLSGFVGKLLVMDSLRLTTNWHIYWALVLGTSLIAVVGFARAGSVLFWKAHDASTESPARKRPRRHGEHAHEGMALTAIGALLAMVVALTVAAGPVVRVLDATADQLYARSPYIEAVMGPQPVPGPAQIEAGPEAGPDADPAPADPAQEG
jgi:multicomponent K+:H+ antiporter subunit D